MAAELPRNRAGSLPNLILGGLPNFRLNTISPIHGNQDALIRRLQQEVQELRQQINEQFLKSRENETAHDQQRFADLKRNEHLKQKLEAANQLVEQYQRQIQQYEQQIRQFHEDQRQNALQDQAQENQIRLLSEQVTYLREMFHEYKNKADDLQKRLESLQKNYENILTHLKAKQGTALCEIVKKASDIVTLFRSVFNPSYAD